MNDPVECHARCLIEEYRYFLPSDFDVRQHFDGEAEVVVACNPSEMETFKRVWRGVLAALTPLTRPGGALVCFQSISQPREFAGLPAAFLHTVWRAAEEIQFYMSPVKCIRGAGIHFNRVVMEYSPTLFTTLLAHEDFDAAIGDCAVMGIGTERADPRPCYEMNIADEHGLADLLQSPDTVYWWYCHRDYDGISLWVRDLSSEELVRRVKTELDWRGIWKPRVDLLDGAPKGPKGGMPKRVKHLP